MRKQTFTTRLLMKVVQPETATFLLLIIALVVGLRLSPYFADINFILDSTSIYIEYGFIALIMTFVIIAGQMDLSVACLMAMSACISAVLYSAGIPMVLSIILTLCIGALAGFFNSVLVTRLSITPMIATIGTMSLFRGVAQTLLGDGSISGFPEWFESANKIYIVGTHIPVILGVFIILCIVMTWVLKKTLFGRLAYQIGSNESAALYSGVEVKKIKRILYIASSIFASISGLILMSRLTVSRFDMAKGGELDIITMVLLGGTSINGGKGTIIGTMISFLLVVFLRTGMTVANIKAEVQLIAMGSLLILAIIITNMIEKWQNRLTRSFD